MRKLIESAVFKCLQMGGKLENFTVDQVMSSEKLKKLTKYQLIAVFLSFGVSLSLAIPLDSA